jgi:CheY-like chemotaxis protein
MPSSKPLSILLVEDDEIDQRTVKRAFVRNNITNPIFTADNGKEGLEFLRDADTPRPSLILLDLNMPVLSGLEFLEEVKADPELRSIPVVVLTSSAQPTDKTHSYELGVAGYIVKPVDFVKLVEATKVLNVYWTLCEKPE